MNSRLEVTLTLVVTLAWKISKVGRVEELVEDKFFE
jgi:hypothetical protein